jgi:VanZ family protein
VTVLRTFRRPRLWLGLWLLLIAEVVIISLLPSDALPKASFIGIDKVEHFLAYATLSLYAAMLFASRRLHLRAAVGLVLLGLLMEVAQALLTQSRAADPADALANALGVLVGWALGGTRVARLMQWTDLRLR